MIWVVLTLLLGLSFAVALIEAAFIYYVGQDR